MKVLLLFCALLPFVFGHGRTNPSCPPYWTSYGSNCWRYFPNPLTFADAEATCAQFAPCNSYEIGTLATITSPRAQMFLRFWLGDFVSNTQTPDVWIGLSDRRDEGTFEWVDGQQMNYNNFVRGQPDNGRSAGVNGENCVMYSGALNGWDDVQCALTLPFICAMPLETPQMDMPTLGGGIPGPRTGGPRAGPGQTPAMVKPGLGLLVREKTQA